jgi:hypothetical protein
MLQRNLEYGFERGWRIAPIYRNRCPCTTSTQLPDTCAPHFCHRKLIRLQIDSATGAKMNVIFVADQTRGICRAIMLKKGAGSRSPFDENASRAIAVSSEACSQA